MKQIWLFTMVFFLLFSGTGQAQFAGMIKNVSGKVDILRQSKLYPAWIGFRLEDKDIVITGPEGFAGMLFKDDTVITLGPESEFEIDTYIFEPQDQAYYFLFYMEKGSMIYNSGKVGKLSPQSVHLATPSAVVGIRGTRFIVDLK
ncbi:MAG: FecR family protein [Desulfotignum sp.]|nr:FecR family protein [Desulfotignum sp.]